MRWPESVLVEDEEVLVHVHPHWATVFWPVTGLLLVVGAASFATSALPPGAAQEPLRLVVGGLAVVLALLLARPLLRWATTHLVLTDRRLLHRRGLLGRRGRDLSLGGVVAVSFEQSPGQRLLRSGSLLVDVAGQPEPAVFRSVPRVEVVHGLVEALRHELPGDEPAGWGAAVGGLS